MATFIIQGDRQDCYCPKCKVCRMLKIPKGKQWRNPAVLCLKCKKEDESARKRK